MSVRSLNFTKRSKILLEWIHIELEETDTGITARGHVDLSHLDLVDGHLVIDFRNRATRKRVDIGSALGRLDFSQTLAISAAPSSLLCDVRVLSTNPDVRGKVLAAALNVRPTVHGDQSQEGILDIVPDPDLGQRLWRFTTDNDKPELHINSNVDWRELARSTEFQALVYPQVIEDVATWLFHQARGLTGEAEDENQEIVLLWLGFFRDAGFDLLVEQLDDDDLDGWREQAVKAITAKWNLVQLWSAMQEVPE